MASSVLFGDVMVRNGIFLTIGEHSYFVYYPIISYLSIKFYRAETKDMERHHWNNGVSGMVLIYIVVSTMLLIVRDKILW